MHFNDDDAWDLEIEGFEVTQIGADFYPMDIIAHGPAQAKAMIRLEGRFEFHRPNSSVTVVDLNESTPTLLSVLRNDVIRLARITKASELRVDFASGYSITSSADASCENWEVHTPGKRSDVLVIARPGGGEPAIWDGETPPRTFKVIDGQHVEITDR